VIKDRIQKEKALKYVVSRCWFPQLEADVSTYLTTGKKVLNITDIDVLASIPDDFLGYRNMLIDCKGTAQESPINRALWQKGLMARIDANYGICILKRKNIETDHRYTASQLGITLISENEFDNFAHATSPRYNSINTALSNIDIWGQFFSIPAKFPRLAPAISFSKSHYWMSDNETEACRRTLFQLSGLKPELDPAKQEHVAIVGDFASLFMHSLAVIVSKMFPAYLQPEKKEVLSDALLFLLYGGRDSYQARNRLKQMMLATKGIEKVDSELSLPEWDRFVQLVRQLLDAPLEVNRTPLIIREIAWSYIAGITNRDFVKEVASLFPQAARFAVLGIDYVCRATKIPPEFQEILVNELMKIQMPK